MSTGIVGRTRKLIVEEGLLILIVETLRRFNLQGGLWAFTKYWTCRLINKSTSYKTILGSKMKLDISCKGVQSELFVRSIREAPATKHFITLLNKDATVVDIGANIGYYALLEAKLCKQVYAIEPDFCNFFRLIENIKLNNYENISAHILAIGKQKGIAKFKLSNNPNWHRIAPSNCDNSINIKVLSLDEFLGGKKVEIVRMDVEGYELNILQGMRKTIENNYPTMFIETHKPLIEEYGGSLRELYKLLAEYDYTIDCLIIRNKPSITGKIRELIDNPILYQSLGSWLFVKKEA